MYTKSKIQVVRESIDAKNTFKAQLNDLMDDYMVTDNIFVCQNGKVSEVVEGYFVCNGEYENLNEAFDSIADNNVAIRVIRNSEFQVGQIFNLISECPQDSEFPILHISEQEYVID